MVFLFNEKEHVVTVRDAKKIVTSSKIDEKINSIDTKVENIADRVAEVAKNAFEHGRELMLERIELEQLKKKLFSDETNKT